MGKPVIYDKKGGAGRLRVGAEPANDCLSPLCKYVFLNKETGKLVCGRTGETSNSPDMRRPDCR